MYFKEGEQGPSIGERSIDFSQNLDVKGGEPYLPSNVSWARAAFTDQKD